MVMMQHLRAGATQRQNLKSVVIRPFWQLSSQSILQMLLLRGDNHYSISVEWLFHTTPAVMEFTPVDLSDFGNSKQPTANKKKVDLHG